MRGRNRGLVFLQPNGAGQRDVYLHVLLIRDIAPVAVVMTRLQDENLCRHIAFLCVLPKHIDRFLFLDPKARLARFGELRVFLEPSIEHLTRYAEQFGDGFGVVVRQGVFLDPRECIFRRVFAWHGHRSSPKGCRVTAHGSAAPAAGVVVGTGHSPASPVLLIQQREYHAD